MALSRPAKLVVLATMAATLIGLLAYNITESRTIVVAAQGGPSTPTPSGTVVGVLQAPRYSGRATNGTQWNLSAQSASQMASGSQAEARNAIGQISLTTLVATLEKPHQPPLALMAPQAQYSPNTTRLVLPQGLGVSGTLGGYALNLQSQEASAELSSSQIHLTGGVSATLWPR